MLIHYNQARSSCTAFRFCAERQFCGVKLPPVGLVECELEVPVVLPVASALWLHLHLNVLQRSWRLPVRSCTHKKNTHKWYAKRKSLILSIESTWFLSRSPTSEKSVRAVRVVIFSQANRNDFCPVIFEGSFSSKQTPCSYFWPCPQRQGQGNWCWNRK